MNASAPVCFAGASTWGADTAGCPGARNRIPVRSPVWAMNSNRRTANYLPQTGSNHLAGISWGQMFAGLCVTFALHSPTHLLCINSTILPVASVTLCVLRQETHPAGAWQRHRLVCQMQFGRCGWSCTPHSLGSDGQVVSCRGCQRSVLLGTQAQPSIGCSADNHHSIYVARRKVHGG